MSDEGVTVSMGHPHRASSEAQMQHSLVSHERGSLLQAQSRDAWALVPCSLRVLLALSPSELIWPVSPLSSENCTELGILMLDREVCRSGSFHDPAPSLYLLCLGLRL